MDLELTTVYPDESRWESKLHQKLIFSMEENNTKKQVALPLIH